MGNDRGEKSFFGLRGNRTPLGRIHSRDLLWEAVMHIHQIVDSNSSSPPPPPPQRLVDTGDRHSTNLDKFPLSSPPPPPPPHRDLWILEIDALTNLDKSE